MSIEKRQFYLHPCYVQMNNNCVVGEIANSVHATVVMQGINSGGYFGFVS